MLLIHCLRKTTTIFFLCFIQMTNNLKRPHKSKSDVNNNEIISSTMTNVKKKKLIFNAEERHSHTIGQVKELLMINFMCHKNFSIEFHPIPMQIITGANGSGKLE